MVRLQKLVPTDCAQVLVKLEYTNPTGSYKGRMALAMIEEAENRGDLKPGMTVVEYTGGSTGSSLAFVCAVKGYPFKVVSSNAFSREKLQTMKAFGADLVIVHSDSGVTTPDLIPRMIEKAKQLADSDDCYFTDQIYNRDIIVGYSNIGREEGIFAGTSSAMNVVGALQLAAELGPGKTVITVAVDTGLKYLDSELFR